MLSIASGQPYPLLFEVDGAVDADDRAFLLKLYGGIPFDAPSTAVEEPRGKAGLLKRVGRVNRLG